MKKVILYACLCVKIVLGQWVVSDNMAHIITKVEHYMDRMLAIEQKTREVVLAAANSAKIAQGVKNDLLRYKKIAEELQKGAKEQVDLLKMIARLKGYGIASAVLEADILLLNFSLEDQMKIFDILEEMIRGTIDGIMKAEVVATRDATNKRILEALETYQQKRKEILSLQAKLNALEAMYLTYESEFKNFQSFYHQFFKL